MNQEIPPNNTLYLNNLNEKTKINVLKEKLMELFGKFGNIIDCVAARGLKKKGQAFIVYEDIDNAKKAKEELQGKILEGKEIRINFAKTKSDAFAKIDGTLEEQINERKRKRDYKKEEEEVREKKRKKKERKKKLVEIPPNKKLFVENISETVNENVTNTIHFKNLFQKFDGCLDVRYIPQKNVAFIEFESESLATIVKKETNGYHLFGKPLSVSYAK